MPGRSKPTYLLMTFMAFLMAYVMVFSMVPTWAIADNADVDGTEMTGDDTSEQDESANEATNEEAPGDDEETESTESADVIEGDEQGSKEDESAEADKADTEADKAATEADEADQASKNAETTPAALEEEATVKTDAKTEETAAAEPEAADPVHVLYRTHIQKKGWGSYVSDGEVSGSTGQSLRMEGLQVKLDLGSSELTGGIQYRAHVQKQGWQGWVNSDELSGTTGKSLRVEAIKIQLTGALKDKYDVYYSVHAQRKGWMAWAMNGASAGTAGQSLRLEAIKIVLVEKEGGTKPDSSFVQYGRAYEGASLITVQSHVQRIGWQGVVGNGATSGTTGRGLRLEAIKIATPGMEYSGNVQIAGHIQGIGWTGYANGYTGTVGQSKRLEAVKIKLSGELASYYDVYYRVHVAHLGWMNWACNGAEAGTSGMADRMEAIQVLLVGRGSSGPSSSGSAVSETYLTGTNIAYKPHCQSYGWRGESWNGGVAGTTGQSKRLEALTVRLSGGTIGGGVGYSAYVAGSGWQGSKYNGGEAGTTHRFRGIEGIKIWLTGRAAQMYDVYYSTHVTSAGWLGWAKNGQVAGAPNTGRSIEAIQIRLVPKGSNAPSNSNYAIDRSYFDDPMIRQAQGYSSPTDWLIMVDDARTKLGVFRGSQGHWSKVDMWTVATGAPTSPSKHGVFSVGSRGYSFGHGYTCYWWVEWSGPYLFHSIKYHEGTFDVQDPSLGVHVSGGCVRMPIERAKWIYDTIPSGTTVVVY